LQIGSELMWFILCGMIHQAKVLKYANDFEFRPDLKLGFSFSF